MQLQIVRVMAVLGSGDGQEVCRATLFKGFQSAPWSTDSNTPPQDIPTHMCFGPRGSTRIECILGPSGFPSRSPPTQSNRFGCSLKLLTPSQVRPQSAERKSPCGGRACIPDVRLGGMTRCQPEDVVDHQRLTPTTCFLERRWASGLLPGSTRVRGSKHRRAEVTCTGCGEHRLSVSRVEKDVIDDVP